MRIKKEVVFKGTKFEQEVHFLIDPNNNIIDCLSETELSIMVFYYFKERNKDEFHPLTNKINTKYNKNENRG